MSMTSMYMTSGKLRRDKIPKLIGKKGTEENINNVEI